MLAGTSRPYVHVYVLHGMDLSSTTVRSTTVVGRYMYVPFYIAGAGLTPKAAGAVTVSKSGFEPVEATVLLTSCEKLQDRAL